MLKRLRNPGVTPSIMLIIIILWALLAVVMLTNTLVTARQIDNRVGVINDEVGPIDNELDNVALAQQTSVIAEQIQKAAVPLSGQLTQTNESVKGIDASGKDVLGNAETINGSAKEINSTVRQINGNVNSIGSTLDSVEGNAESINDSVDGITASFAGTLSEAISVNDDLGAPGINRRADIVAGQGRAIAANVGNVTEVQVPAILINSQGIEDSPLLANGLGDDQLGDILDLNQLAAAGALPAPEPAQSPLAGALPRPDLGEVPAPGEQPAAPELGGGLLGSSDSEQSDSEQSGESESSPENDSGSLLGSVAGGQ